MTKYSYGKRSRAVLRTLCPELQDIMEEAIKYYDISLLSGFRDKEEQNELVARGLSKLEYPKSYHNTNPSKAVDFAPWPIDWNNSKGFIALSYFIKGIATSKGYTLRLGCDWNGDLKFNERFFDGGHLELRG